MRPEFFINRLYLHIPDGMLNVATSIICWVLAAILIGIAIYKVRGELGERQIPLMGVMAAFIFAAQMINFTVIGGTSGHLIGGALAAIALGPWAGMLVMSAVVIIQGLVFQDGGLLVMGANLLNMALISTIVGFGIYKVFGTRSWKVRMVGVFAASWLSVMAAAFSTSIQLWLSGTAGLGIVVPAMMGIHALIGIGEALITTAAVAFVLRARPDLIDPNAGKSRGGRGWIAAASVIVLVVLLLTPFASANPDGLERVAIDLGFIDKAQSAPYSVIPDYELPVLGATSWSTFLAGLIGVLIVVGVVAGISLIRKSQGREG